MRINNNLMAMNTHRQLGINSNNGAKSIEKLSSGYRINRAGDDAAGLAISEKMRGQIRGLNQASRNSQDAISLVQTAEGALNETQAILQRMRELAVQSATDTNVATDRTALQNEVDELTKEITRIASTTEFNTQKLLDGKFAGTFQIGANESQNVGLTIANMDAASLKVEGAKGAEFSITGATTDVDNGADDANSLFGSAAGGEFEVMTLEEYNATTGTAITWSNSATTEANTTHVLVGKDTGNAFATTGDGLTYTELNAAANERDTVVFLNEVTDGDVTLTATTATATATLDKSQVTLSGGEYTISDITSNPVYGGTYNVGLTDADGNVVALGATDLAGGVAAAAANVVNWVNVNDTSESLLTMTAAQTGLAVGDVITVGGDGIDVSTQASASSAITTINDAITAVSAERAKLGAVQNRLEHTIKNLDTSAENLQASESRIRDVDMAKEMMEFTKNNILQQAAQAMLAQANQAPQGVLQLLR